ncbi:MAG: alkaline phosphatase family protein [Methylocystis sp.]|uniref:alkaline phosphatase family protein n=1 Tax=Methylocystis sp. TaxID=1911079 RepID=UPI003DA338B2
MKSRTLAAVVSASLTLSPLTASAEMALIERVDLAQFNHVVVIYEENHSFDNLWGTWGDVGSDDVKGLRDADAAHTKQARLDGSLYNCLLQNDPHFTSPPLSGTCIEPSPYGASHFPNAPFSIDSVLSNAQNTEDLVHRFYNEQFQLHQGRQDRYTLGSDAAGLTQGYYKAQNLPLFQYLHGVGAPKYVIADGFFQAAFGGSFLNHQWLVAATTPVFASALNDGSSFDLHSGLDSNLMPASTPLYANPLGSLAKDLALTQSCSPAPSRAPKQPGAVCGDYVVNTIQPATQPYAPGTATQKRLPLLDGPTIGDRLTERRVDWAWYSGGWSNAAGKVGAPGWTNGDAGACADPNTIAGAVYPNCPNKLFQFHHQPFNYFSRYASGAARDAHLLDEVEFLKAAQTGALKPVSFIKPIGGDNEHPGYTNVAAGDSHLVELIKAVVNGPNAFDTLIVITYDEFGGAWDHVPPPGQGRGGVHDQWGPGTRIPAMLISRRFIKSGVDHLDHDTTSILRLIEERFNVSPLGARDASVRSLSSALVKGM